MLFYPQAHLWSLLIVLRQNKQQQVLFKSLIDSTTLFESTPAASSKILQKTRRLHLLQMMECKIENDLPVIENEHLEMQQELEKNSSVFICWPFHIKCKSVNQWDQTPLKKTASNFIAAYPCKLPTAPTVWVKRRLFVCILVFMSADNSRPTALFLYVLFSSFSSVRKLTILGRCSTLHQSLSEFLRNGFNRGREMSSLIGPKWIIC